MSAFADVQSQLQVAFEASLKLWERYAVGRGTAAYRKAVSDSTGLYAIIVGIYRCKTSSTSPL